MPAKLTLTAARNVPWAPTINYFYTGSALALDDATAKMQVRLYPGAPGDPLADLTDIEFVDGLPTDEEVARQGLSDGVRVLRFYPEIAQADLEAFPTGLNEPEAGEADRFSYDLLVDYGDGVVDPFIAGDFLLTPGVTNDA